MTEENDQVLVRGRELTAKLLANPKSFREYNDFLHLFFKGLSIDFLAELLRSPDGDVVAGALFFAEELGGFVAPLLKEIVAHAYHPNPRIRISAYEVLGGSALSKVQDEFFHVVLGMRDAELACRKIAMLWMMRVDDARLRSALQCLESAGLDAEIQEGLRTLLGESAHDGARIHAWVLDENPFVRKIGLIAAGREAMSDPHLLELASQSDDPDLRACATTQIQFNEIGRRHQMRKAGRCAEKSGNETGTGRERGS